MLSGLAIAALQQAIDGVQARNYLTGHRSSVTSVVFSRDGIAKETQ
ncbi:hypothetical protein KBT16_20330 [Nostoc sp. CCCryo 231-06]|nr:hypothetical protein [Nostoc commune]MCL6753185.1 hypothetical protein [Nostoc sp. CCCryo 231-06]